MITVFGSINLDLIGRVGRIPKPGETVPGSSFATAPGGKGANQALAARRAGARVRMVGAAGQDAMGDQALALLEAGGVDLSAVKRLDLPQGVAMIFVDDSGENVIGILPGANAAVSVANADLALGDLGPGDVLVVQQEVAQDATLTAVDLARRRGARSILNTAPFLPSTAGAAKHADIVVANETEFALLAGDGDLEALMRAWAKANGRTIIVTLGPDGARAATPDAWLSVPAMKIRPVDTVGAGDTFVGYLAAGLDAGLSLEAAMARGAVAASLACLKPGAQPSIPMAAEVDAALGR
ncbi:MAG: ribokinase [Devosia nanyangense]|uniref:Ribokinase n=1 Tax=Devosia nanyangense TaxID=1228055 RepID=A0A933L272_9HYPH|nr:ribokinase [Devosia nanyangense]